MRKFWKIFGITIGSLLGVVLIAVLIAMYIVFTPQRLTPIVNNIADKYITTPHRLDNVELTFFSTFPEAGVQINSLLVINDMAGAQSDTVLAAEKVVAVLDWKKYLNDKTLDVRELSLHGVSANIYINPEGKTNLDVLNLEKDTTEDTTALSLPFDYLNVDKLALDIPSLTFLSDKDTLSASVTEAKIEASAKGMDNISLLLEAGRANAVIRGETYLHDARVELESAHTAVDLENMHFTLPDARLALNEFAVGINGDVCINDDILLNAHLNAEDWDVPGLISLLPQSISQQLEGIEVKKASVSLEADVAGTYNDTIMPLIDAVLTLHDGSASYMEVFPYQISKIEMKANAHIDMNEKKESKVDITHLSAQTGKTTLSASGHITELLDDALLNISLKPNVQLSEFKRYLAAEGKTTDLSGNAQGALAAKIRLSDLTGKRLAKGYINGQLNIKDLDLLYDSLKVSSPQADLVITIPYAKAQRKAASWAQLQLEPRSLTVEMIDRLQANLSKTKLVVSTSDLLASTDLVKADLTLSTSDIKLKMDSMGGELIEPQLTGQVDYNNQLPADQRLTGNANLAFNSLDGFYQDIKARLQASTLKAKMQTTAGKPDLSLDLSTEAMEVAQTNQLQAGTGALKLKAKAVRDKTKQNLLLQWNPQLNVQLSDGHAQLSSLTENIQVPHISFDYSNKLFDIADSRIQLGNSDFSLKGQVRNIGAWLEDKGILTGQIDFNSAHTDVNEIMALTSAKSGTEESDEQVSKEEQEQQKAYLVPKNVDLALRTNITEALVFDQVARELGGQLYVKDGVLVLEEMGFICNAAKLQLTAIYKTPRRNHIYVGLDYHMLDIDMQELVNMIPQIDTMMPMLRSFRGEGEFHLAAETYVNDKYQLKTSTTRGACSITGKDLVLLDSETFGKISKILLFNRKTENKVDSISAQATLFKKEIDIYPFCITMDKYMAAVGGRHNLDMSFDYHISLLKPLYIGVDVKGTFDDLKIRPAMCKYAQDFRPIIRRDIETQNQTLKKMIDEALKRNVKPQ